MVSMQVVIPTLQIDKANMRKEFYVGYHLRFQVFYVSLENIHGEIENVTFEKVEMSWSFTWRSIIDKFDALLDTKPTLSHLKGKFFHMSKMAIIDLKLDCLTLIKLTFDFET